MACDVLFNLHIEQAANPSTHIEQVLLFSLFIEQVSATLLNIEQTQLFNLEL